MKKITLLIVSMLMVTLLAMAQIKFIVYKADGSTIELLATEVDSIGFEGNNEQPENPDKPYIPNANGHEYVDLGLPSGTLWATMNVGAKSEEDYGDYFAWGETEPKEYYYWNTYKWYDQENENITKYCTNADYGLIDNRGVIELSDDAARINWGGSWRIPTEEELLELWRFCDFTWTTQNGVAGYRVSRSNGNSIFLPAAGFRILSSLDSETLKCIYWSSTISKGNEECAFSYSFDSVGLCVGDFHRNYGLSIRPVLPLEYNYTIKFDANGGEGEMASDSAEYATLITLPENMYEREGYEFVGWNTNADGSGNFYKDSQTFSVSSDITLYAQWKEIGSDNEEGELPETLPQIMVPGDGYVTIAIYVPSNTCNGVILVGNGLGEGGADWAPDLKNNPFTELEGEDRWYTITVPYSDDLGVKAIALTPEGEAYWNNQWGMNNDLYENVVILQGQGYFYLENGGEPILTELLDGSVVYIGIKEWKSAPCAERNKAGIAKIIATLPEVPEGYVVGVVGKFEEPVGVTTKFWDLESGVFPMTKGADGKYTIELEVPDACEFKILLSADGTAWDWNIGQADDYNFIMDLDLVSEVEVTAWNGLLDE